MHQRLNGIRIHLQVMYGMNKNILKERMWRKWL